VGPTIAAVLVVEIGDIDRFRSAVASCSWAGLTPKHRQSDTKTTRGPITKQGSKLVRWALIEAVSRYHGGAALAPRYYSLRDGEIRCIAQAQAA
jgi:transposase